MKNRKIDNRKNDPFPEIAEWQRGNDAGMTLPIMHTYPQPGDNIKKIKSFTVKDAEKALLFAHGELISDLTGGAYELEKNIRSKGTQIVWFDTSMFSIPWGIPQPSGIPTADGFMVGMYGDLKLHVSNVKTFYKYTVGGESDWNLQRLKEWIKGLLHTSLRDIFLAVEIADILKKKREETLNRVVAKVYEEFALYGIELDSFNILGFKAPENAQPLLTADQNSAIRLSEYIKKEQLRYLDDQDVVRNRIDSLKKRLQDLQDQFLEDKVDKDAFRSKKAAIQLFITDSEAELNDIKMRKGG